MPDFREKEELGAAVKSLVAGDGIECCYFYTRPKARGGNATGGYKLCSLYVGKKDSDSAPLIFIPGPPGNHHAMLYFARKGAALGHRVIIPDMNGMGKSKGGDPSLATFDNYAAVDIPAIIAEAADAFGSRVFLGGLCGGGGFSLLSAAFLAHRRSKGDELAGRTLDRLCGLVTLATPIDFSREEKFKRTWKRFYRFFPHDGNFHHTSLIGKFYSPFLRKKDDENLYRFIKHSYKYGIDDFPSAVISRYFDYFKTGRFMIEGADCMEQIGLLGDLPVLMVSGRGDEFFSYRALSGLYRELKRAGHEDYAYVVFKDLGHIPVVGSRCDLIWDNVFDPWLTGKRRGVAEIGKLLKVDDRNIVGRSGKYR